MDVEPIAKKFGQFVGQADGDPRHARRTVFCGGLDDRLYLVIGNRRDDRSDVDVNIHPSLRQLPHRVEPFRRGRRPRLQCTCQFRVERSHRQRHPRQLQLRQLDQQVDILQNPRRLGGNHNRMLGLQAQLQYPSRYSVGALNRLIGVGIGTNCNRQRLITRPGQRLAEQCRSIRFGEQLAFKIQSRRQIMIGMARPRIAIDTAMFATPIRVNRPVKRQIGRCVKAQNRFRIFFRNRCPQTRHRAIQQLARIQPIPIRLPRIQIETRRHHISRRAATGC